MLILYNLRLNSEDVARHSLFCPPTPFLKSDTFYEKFEYDTF